MQEILIMVPVDAVEDSRRIEENEKGGNADVSG